MIELSSATLEKYKKGYKKASSVLAAYMPPKKTIIETIREKETGGDSLINTLSYTTPENFKFYTIRECNKLINFKLAEEKKKPPRGSMQIGQANKPNGLPYARIYSNPKTGEIYVIFTNL